jgi:hypothetical protein
MSAKPQTLEHRMRRASDGHAQPDAVFHGILNCLIMDQSYGLKEIKLRSARLKNLF